MIDEIKNAKQSNSLGQNEEKIKVGLIGSSGKIGKEIMKSAARQNILIIPFFRSAPLFGPEFVPEYSLESVFEKSDVIINFSHEIYYNLSEKYSKPMLLGSTGHKNIDDISDPPFAFMYAPNVLVEWNILKVAAEKIANYGNFTISIDDIHHPAKKDAPSGTAKDLSFAKGATIRSIRQPEVASWHLMSFFSREQVVRIEHQVLNRAPYADSSLKIAHWLQKQAPGRYQMSDFVADLD